MRLGSVRPPSRISCCFRPEVTNAVHHGKPDAPLTMTGLSNRTGEDTRQARNLHLLAKGIARKAGIRARQHAILDTSPAQTALPDAIATVLGEVWSVPDRVRLADCCALPDGSLRGYWAPKQPIQPRGRNTLITRFTPGGGKGPPPPMANSLPPPDRKLENSFPSECMAQCLQLAAETSARGV